MKKGLKTIGLFLSILLLTTGCYDYKVEMTVNDDKSVDFNMGINMDLSSMADMFGDEGFGIDDPSEDMDLSEASGIDEESQKALEARGYKVNIEEDNENLKYNVSIAKKFDNIDTISSDEEVKVDMDKIMEDNFKDVFFTSKKGLLKTTYTAYFIFDLSGEETEGMEEYKDYIKASYVLNLPNESKSNNASNLSNDSKTLTWNLELGKKNEVIYEFELPNDNATAIIGGGVAGVVLLVAACAVLAVKLTKKKNPIEKEVA